MLIGRLTDEFRDMIKRSRFRDVWFQMVVGWGRAFDMVGNSS